MDLLAGLTVGLTTVPQALAYAEVAGLPVQVNDLFLCHFYHILLFIFILHTSFCIDGVQQCVHNFFSCHFLTEEYVLAMQVF